LEIDEEGLVFSMKNDDLFFGARKMVLICDSDERTDRPLEAISNNMKAVCMKDRATDKLPCKNSEESRSLSLIHYTSTLNSQRLTIAVEIAIS
jgi:hypothetical protein